jgi:virulence factor Mce-like protein
VRKRNTNAFSNPVLIGAVTVLAAMVAVFLAYSANQGLPFVPTRELKVDIPDGSNLVVGNDVREGGFRIGFVSDLKPVTLATGMTAAELTLKLNKAQSRVPVDSHVLIRTRSVLGLKYVDIQTGRSSQLIPDGGTLPIAQTNVPVQFDQVFSAFDPKTRKAIQDDLVGFGDTLAGRGNDLNRTIAALPELFRHLTPVAAYLSDPRTGLTSFFNSLERFMSTVAPVADVNSKLFTEMATTFAAISNSPSDLQSTISESPSTLDVSTDSLRAQQPFLADLNKFGLSLTPASAQLRSTLPLLNPAIEAGTKTLVQTPSLNSRLQQVMNALKSLSLAPGTNVAINALADTTSTLNPMIRYLGPYVTVCNTWNYWWTYLSEHLSEKTSFGFAQRALLNQANGFQPNNVGQQGATAPANGGGSDSPLGGNEFLHVQPYGAAIDNQGNADCETGQRGYPHKLNHFDPQARNLATDVHTPGDQGPTFAGLPHVPQGETFSRNPQIGPQVPFNPSNP